jgi:hypothetical protein
MTRCRNPRPARNLAARVVLPLAVLLLRALPAGAETSPYYLGVSESYTHDSNLLRLGDGVDAPTGFSRSDSVYTTALLAGFDQPFGRQHAHADLTLRDNHYHANTVYNNNSYAASAGLDWSTAGRISGTLTGSINHSLSSFNNYYGVSVLPVRNMQTVVDINAGFNLGLVTRYSLVATLGHHRVSNSLDESAVLALDYEQDSGSFGLQWAPSDLVTLALTASDLAGRYPNYLFDGSSYTEDRFKQSAVNLTGNLQPSGGSKLDARLSYARTRYDLNQARDFSGVTGTLGWVWTPRSKLHLSTRLTRDTGQNSYGQEFLGIAAATDYSQVSNTLRLQADYELSGKITTTAAWQATQRRVVNTFELLGTAQGLEASDRSNLISAGLRWAPLRSVLIGCDLSREQRSASGPGAGSITFPLNDSIVSCFGQFQLQQ